MAQKNKPDSAPAETRGSRKAALMTYPEKHRQTKAQPSDDRKAMQKRDALADKKEGTSKNADAKAPKKMPTVREGGTALSFSHTFTAPILCAVVYILILATRSLDLATSSGTEAYLTIAAIQLFVFMIPSVFYIRLRSLDMRDDLRLRLPSPDKIMFLVLCTAVLILTSVLLSAVGGVLGTDIYEKNIEITMPELDSGTGALYYAVCFAVIPAVCEEMLFRSIIMSEYQKSSILSAVILSSLFFAMLHFSLPNFPFYFFAGLVLSVCTYATGSSISSFAVHLGYNLFALFGGDTVRVVVDSIGELSLIVIVCLMLLLLFLTLALGECQRIYASYARKNKESSYLPEYKKGTGGLRLAVAILSPASLVCMLIYIVSVLLIK